MGWNKGYEIFEKTVIGAYDAGILDKPCLSVLMEPYRGTDIDCGGSRGLKTKDGKGAQQVVIETWGLVMPSAPDKDVDDDGAWESHYEEIYELFFTVTDHFGWA